MPVYSPAAIMRRADKRVIRDFHRACADEHAGRRVRVALFEAGIVEANLRNPDYGDRDSVGALQQRSGWGTHASRMDPYASAVRFIRDAHNRVVPKFPRYRAAKIAQAVQRSAYPSRYAQAYLAACYVIARTR